MGSFASPDPQKYYRLPSVPLRSVAVIGAGPSGLATARHLLAQGIKVRVFERNAAPGGTWLYSGEASRQDSVGEPCPVYYSLTNNIALPLVQLKDFPWPSTTRWNEPHHVLAKYLQAYAKRFGISQEANTLSVSTRVDGVVKIDADRWQVTVTSDETGIRREEFDAVVVATGHYSQPSLPLSCPGLSELLQSDKRTLVMHSKQYRVPDSYKDQVVLLVGAGTSGLDIHHDLRGHASKIYHSVRDKDSNTNEDYRRLRAVQTGAIDALGPPSFRVGEIQSLRESERGDVVAIVRLEDGTELHDVQRIIYCTGYLHSFSFLPQFHLTTDQAQTQEAPPSLRDSIESHAPDDKAIVTDGKWTQNLHEDIFYRHDPTLAFVGVSIGTATFSFFEFQSIAVAHVFAGLARLPTIEDMRELYWQRVQTKGAGRSLHIMGSKYETAYVRDLVAWLNAEQPPNRQPIVGHQPWFEATRRVSTENALAHMQGKPYPNRRVDDVETETEGVQVA